MTLGIQSLASSSNNPSPFHHSAANNNGNFPSAVSNSYQSLPCLSKPGDSSSLVREGVEQPPKGTRFIDMIYLNQKFFKFDNQQLCSEY